MMSFVDDLDTISHRGVANGHPEATGRNYRTIVAKRVGFNDNDPTVVLVAMFSIGLLSRGIVEKIPRN